MIVWCSCYELVGPFSLFRGPRFLQHFARSRRFMLYQVIKSLLNTGVKKKHWYFVI